MRLFGVEIHWRPQAQTLTLDQLIQRLETMFESASGINVTPDSAMQSPTVQAIVQAVAGAISTLPVHVLEKSEKNGRAIKEPLPNHPVTRLLREPNDNQDRVTYWLDAGSWLIRHGNHYAVKARGATGPIRRLNVVPPGHMDPKQGDTGALVYTAHTTAGPRDYTRDQVHHVRGPARDGLVGDSPVSDVREAIALEIAAEKFGASFFGNGAMPATIFSYEPGSQGHKTNEGRKQFIEDYAQSHGRGRTFRSLFLPRGVKIDMVKLENDKAQFLETRKLQRNVIAGAFGIPPHLVGDLERGTFSNIEHQSLEFVQRVVLRYVRMFEAAMERDLLTPADRAQGIIIRFNMDGLLRGDFASRQAGLKTQREMGVINANEWREHEGLNPRDDEGGELYWDKGPSGQGTEPEPAPEPEPEPAGNGNGQPAGRRW